MLRKSFLILVIAALVVLGAIVAYAALRLSGGPAETLTRAETMLQGGAPALAIDELNLAERSAEVVGDPVLRERLWRLRYAAYVALDNAPAALHDIALLLQQGHQDDETLLLDQIRLLARAGEGERARLAAIAFLRVHPDHARGLELAGEACQTVYQPLLRQVRETIEAEIGRDDRDQAREAMLSYVYRPAGDPEVARSHATLERVFSVEPLLIAMWPRVDERLRDTRERVQEGLGYFQQALDAGEQPVAAFRAVAAALERSGRVDDLLVTCELQRIHFDHAYVDESGVIATWLHLRTHQDRAALAAGARWTSAERIAERATDGTLSATTGELLFARAVAAWRLGDARALTALAADINALIRAGGTAVSAQQLTLAARRMMSNNDDHKAIDNWLGTLCRRLLRAPVTPGRPDPAAEFVPVMLGRLVDRNAPESDVLALLREWLEARGDTPAPHLAQARYLLGRGHAAAALTALGDVAGLAPRDPELFALRLAASRQHYRDSRLDGPGLLAQCAQRRQALPEVEDPIGYYLCAEAAMAQRGAPALGVAVACARSAVDAFPLAAAPRRLLLEALLARELAGEAAREVARAMTAVVPDAALVQASLMALRAAGEPVQPALRWAMPAVGDSPELQAALLFEALAHAPGTAARFVTEEMLTPTAAGELRLAAARALCLDGQPARAAAVLDSFVAGPGEAGRSAGLDATLLATYADWLVAASAALDDAALAAAALPRRDRLAVTTAPQAPLLQAIARLVDSHPKTAFSLLREALPAARPEERSGADFARAGRLALRSGQFAAAESYWTAALAFADSCQVAEDLTRLLLATDRDERAAEVYTFVTAPSDGALAIRFGRLDLAPALLAAALLRDPGDLLVHAALATFGQASLVDWKPATDALQQDRIELLACLADKDLAMRMLPRAQALVGAAPTVQTNHMLLARALVDAGQPAAAALIHAALFRGGVSNAVLFREVAYAGDVPGYQPDEALLQAVMTAATTGQTGGSRLTLSFGTKAFVGKLEAAGMTDLAEQTRLLMWLGAPLAHPCTDADVDLIARGHPPALACALLAQVLDGGRPVDRRHVIARLFELATVAAADPAQLPLLRVMAQQLLQREGALGPIVHFLLAHPEAGTPPERRFSLLDAHLRQIAADHDDQRWLNSTVAELVEAVGLTAATEHVEAVLRAQPTATPLWLARADLLCRARRDGSAVDELRTVLAHTTDDDAALGLIGLAAAHHVLRQDDRELLRGLPDRVREDAHGRYARGMVALGEGDGKAAIALLDDAAPQPDGRHLFALAQACLTDGAPESVARAAELFAQLLAAYPSSDLARNAGSFVRQLSPRAAAAPPSESNR